MRLDRAADVQDQVDAIKEDDASIFIFGYKFPVFFVGRTFLREKKKYKKRESFQKRREIV